MATETDDHGRNQAEAQLRSILAMLERLEHASNCDGDEDCDLPGENILNGLSLVGDTPSQEQIDDYHDEEKAREAIYEHPLSLEVRSDWYSPGQSHEPAEYCILLCWGGPAARIMGELDDHGEPVRAWLEYQDWGTPWTEYITTGPDHTALVRYAQQFNFTDD